MFSVCVGSNGSSAQVAKFLDDKRPERALEEALDIDSLFQRDDALEKIIDYHLLKDDLKSAKLAASHITSLSSSDRCIKKIFEAHFAKRDMRNAIGVANSIKTISDRDLAIEKIINHYVGIGEPARAVSLLSNLSSVNTASNASSKIFNYYFDQKDFTNAKKILMSARSIKRSDAEKMLAHELETSQLAASVSTCKLVGESGAKKLAEKIEETKPDERTLQLIERQINSSFSLFFSSLAKIISEALMSVYKAMGKDDVVERLNKRIEALGQPDRFIEKHLTAIGLFSYGLLMGAACGFGPLGSLGAGLWGGFMGTLLFGGAIQPDDRTVVSEVEAGASELASTAEKTANGVRRWEWV